MSKILSEKKWVAENFSGIPDGWLELLMGGYAGLEDLRDGKLKTSLTEMKKIHNEIESQLEELGYEPG